jgi:mannose-1-phosphate guanylyltransferase
MYAVILAGGGGTRLWPLSRPERPKPFLPLLGEETLFQRTIERIRPVVGGDENVYCVADRKFGHLVREQAPDVGLLVEPHGRNTAAAIALATAAIDRPDDEVMVVLPADAWIEDEPTFQGVVEAAEAELAGGVFEVEYPLVTLGVQITRPATEYGYLIPDTTRSHKQRLAAYPLLGFEEKPSEHRARQLMDTPGVAWNAGIFIWRRDAIRTALEKYTPLLTLIEPAVGSELALAAAYDRMTPISIDRAVMEGAAADHRVVMASMNVGWSDLGSWTALLEAVAGDRSAGASGRVVQSGESVEVSADDLVVRSVDGRLAVEAPTGGTIVADSIWAHLTGARHLEADVQALLDRVASQEVRA